MWQFRAVHRTVLSARILRLGSVVPYGTVVTLTTEPDGSSDAQQDADIPQDDAAQDDTPQGRRR